VHHCRRDGSCCNGTTDQARRAHAQERLAQGMFGVLLRRRPSKMSTNKWNKLLPSFDFFNYGMGPHNLLALLIEAGLQHSAACNRGPAGAFSQSSRAAAPGMILYVYININIYIYIYIYIYIIYIYMRLRDRPRSRRIASRLGQTLYI
jgi:hypothetical protein